MIEIKNKKMLLFSEDRLIGAKGDINTSAKRFVLDRVQNGFDLGEMVAWIKIEPSGASAYDQLLNREIDGDKIVLTWLLTDVNTQNAGKLSAQIMFASPDYFNAADLANLNSNSLILPAMINGVSAPVWQSYKETFTVEESIDGTQGYTALTKNVLTSALANAVASAESAAVAANDVHSIASEIETDLENMGAMLTAATSYSQQVREEKESASESADEAQNAAESAEASAGLCAQNVQEAQVFSESAAESAASAESSAQSAEEALEAALEAKTDASNYASVAVSLHYEIGEYLQNSVDLLESSCNMYDKMLKERNFRKIFEKTLGSEDTGCVSFEVTKDMENHNLYLGNIVVYILVPQMPNMTDRYLRLDIKGENNSSYSRVVQFLGIDNGSDAYNRVECMQLGRWTAKVVKASDWNQNAETVTVRGVLCSQQRDIDGKPAVALRITQHASPKVPFPEGTYVQIWAQDYAEDFNLIYEN